MVTKDIEKEEVEKRKKEQEEEKKESWWSKVPMQWIMFGVGFWVIRFWSITSKPDGKIQEMWWSVALVLFIWYVLGSRAKKVESGVLSPAEARQYAKTEIERMQRAEEIEPGTQIYWDMNSALQIVDADPKHYLIGFTAEKDHRPHFKQAKVYATGDLKTYCTVQDSVGKFRGDEASPVRNLIKKWEKEGRRQGLDWSDLMWGGGKKK